MLRFLFPLVALLLCLSPPTAGAAEAVVPLTGVGTAVYLDQGNLALLRDGTGALDIRAVADPARAQDFQPLPGNLGLGYAGGAFWLRFAVERTAREAPAWLLEVLPPYLDDLRLYQADGRGGFREFRSGDSLPFGSRSVAYRGFVFPLALPEGPSTFYLRLQSTSTIAAVLSLWQPTAHEAAVQREYLLFGLEKGLLLAAALFSFCAWIYVREPLHANFGLLTLLQLAVGLTLHGFTGQYLLPENPEWAGKLTGILVGLSSASAYYFFIQLLDLRRSFPRLARFYVAGMGLGLATALSVPLGLYGPVATLLLFYALASGLTVYWPCRERLQRGGLRAHVEVLGLFLYLLASTLNILAVLGVGPMQLWLLNGTQLATLAYLLLLGFGVHLRIKEANRLHQEAAQAVEQERLIRADQGRFMAMFAHEIRTPMSIASAALQSLQSLDPLADEPRRRRYQRIEGAVQRMDALLQACLAEERINAGSRFARPEAVAPAALSRWVLDEFGEEQRRRFAFTAAEPLPPVQGEPEMLRVVLRNLLENALKYAPGATPIAVDLAPFLSAGAAGLLWRIADEGPGLEPGTEELIFEKYVRGGESSGTPGLGLGLYLSRRIVAHHGGWLRAEAGRPRGAAFHCWLPLAAVSLADAENEK